MTTGIAPLANSSLQIAAAKSGSNSITPLLLLLGLGLCTYFILIRPQRKHRNSAQQVQASVTPGAEVMTTAGLYATVVDVDDETVTLETAPGVHNRYARAAVARIVTPSEQDSDVEEFADVEEPADGELADGDDEAPHDASRPGR